MTTEPLGILIDIIAAIAVMFVAPMLICSGIKERLTEAQVQELTDSYVENICRHGYIDAAGYEAYLYRLGAAGAQKCVTISCYETVYEPVYSGETFTGEILCSSELITMEEILERIYTEHSAYYLDSLDTVKVSVCDSKTHYVAAVGTVTGWEAVP